MKLYHYVKKGNNVLEKGLLSFAANPDADLSFYTKRTGGETTHDAVCKWMENCYTGRSRAIRGFTEPIKWTERNIRCLKDFVNSADMFEIDIDRMDKDNLIEAVYLSASVLDRPQAIKANVSDELWEKIEGINAIDYSPIDWSVCDDELGHRFAFVRYYLIVVKGGITPPKYLKKVN